ncbi:MAG TPA: ABC transporter ATP-binding protein [Beijerinckiaceae bacterium]|nr:ABC transporter ATP-binding protein [Beijerinckiaceae bacterium]
MQSALKSVDGSAVTSAPSSRAKIKISGIGKRFLQAKAGLFTRTWTPGLEALRNINLNFPEFSFISVLGPSGCGKTTLLRIVAGLIEPTTGTVTIDDKAVTRPRPGSGMVFQYIGLFPWRTIEENVFFSKEMSLHRALREDERETARQFVKLVGLGGFEKSYPHLLSGGMQQRVGIARALAVEPDVLLMDEPFGALDAQTRLILQDELLRICTAYKATVMFITHDIEEAIYLSDQIVVMSRRPGEVKFVVDVDLPRPRDASDVRSSPEFLALRTKIWTSLRDEIIEAGL